MGCQNNAPCTCGWIWSGLRQAWWCICAELASGKSREAIEKEERAWQTDPVPATPPTRD